MQFAVQPPSKSQLGSALYPPIVISVPVTSFIKTGTAVPEIFQGFLQDSNGNVVEHSGPYIASPQPLNISHSSSSKSSSDAEYVVFPDIAINLPGDYTFNVRYYDPSDTQSWSVMGELETRSFTVTDGAVSHKAPGPAESQLLEQLAASGNFGI